MKGVTWEGKQPESNSERLTLLGVSDMGEFTDELQRLMSEHGIGVRELARQVPCNPGHISQLRNGQKRPSAQIAKRLDEVLGAGGRLAALVPGHSSRRSPSRGVSPGDVADDAVELIEL